jgi:hypothetical protein
MHFMCLLGDDLYLWAKCNYITSEFFFCLHAGVQGSQNSDLTST